MLLAGCAAPIKQGWYNFTAYYNTFYNANHFYSDGLQLNERQVSSINPSTPIRVHYEPTRAGQNEFQEAIDRGASILRNHENSKYVAPAILLIGKSYYYRSEFFSALEKFQELERLTSGFERREAILWQGRTLLELRNSSEGIRILESELGSPGDWNSDMLAQMRVMLAQLYVQEQNWNRASENLLLSAEDLESRRLRSRAFFLHGQVLERLGLDNQALAAYRFSSEIRAEYDIEFNSKRKVATLNRTLGNFDTAISKFRSLERDDKFLDYHVEMRYEIAKTYQRKGDSEQAILAYRSILGNQFETADNTTRALVYFGLGEIYRDDIIDFNLAAAYFDSATTVRVDNNRVTESFNAEELARSFGEYASLKREINRTDSLLYLASLESQELDSVLIIIQQQISDEAARAAQESQRTTTTTVVLDADPESTVSTTEMLEFGFLNINNQTMLADASRQFQAVWGDRPLGDNWRRRAAISGSRFDQVNVDAVDGAGVQAPMTENGQVIEGLDLSEIPFADEERLTMRKEREHLQYRLADLFMISLDMPDSAKVYYKKVLDSGLNSEFIPQALYSLIDLEAQSAESDRVDQFINRLLENYPESIYAELVSSRFDVPFERPHRDTVLTVQQRYEIIYQTTGNSAERAKYLQELAMNVTDERQKPLILFEAAREYMSAAIHRDEDRELVTGWLSGYEEYLKESRELAALQDSAATVLENPEGFSDEKIVYWQSISDSTITEFSKQSDSPFEGVYWDSARSVLNEILENYEGSSVYAKANQLNRLIEKSDVPDQDTTGVSERFPDRLMPSDPAPTSKECLDMGLKFSFEGGIDSFMNNVIYPDWTRDTNLRGDLTYRLVVDQSGQVESFEQISRMDRSGIPQAIESAIEEHLLFEPHNAERPITCELTFPIQI